MPSTLRGPKNRQRSLDFFFTDTPPTEIYTLPLHDALPIFAQGEPACGIAHWGVAMNLLGNPFGWPPSPKALADGWAAVERAKTAGAKTQRERDYISAIETFYKDADTGDHRTRALGYRQAMEQLTARYPDDREAAVFYALALNATALPTG